MRPGDFAILVADAVARADPFGILGEVLRLAVELQVVKKHRCRAAGFHRVAHAEAVEVRALGLVSRSEIHGECGRVRKARLRLFFMQVGKLAVVLRLVRVARHRESEAPIAPGGLRIVVEHPAIPRAVEFERRGTKFAGQIRRDECAARLVAARDQPHREPRAFALEVEIQPERSDRPPAAAWLLRIEEAEKYPRAGRSFCDGETPGCREPVLQRFRRGQRGGVRSRLRGALDRAAHFARGFSGEVRRAVSEVLLHRQRRFHDVIVVPFPAGIAVEVFGLECRRIFRGRAKQRHREDQKRECGGEKKSHRGHGEISGLP